MFTIYHNMWRINLNANRMHVKHDGTVLEKIVYKFICK